MGRGQDNGGVRPVASPDSVFRHQRDHLPKLLVEAEGAKDIAHADDLLAQLKGLNAKARELAAKAEGAGDYRTALMAIRELTRLLELTAKLTGELDERAHHSELHMHLTDDRALAIAKTYLERHAAALPSTCSGELTEAGQVFNPVEHTQPLDGDVVAVARATRMKEKASIAEGINHDSVLALAAHDFACYCQLMQPNLQLARHTVALIDRFEAVERRVAALPALAAPTGQAAGIERLKPSREIWQLPPQYGKTTLAQLAVAWFLERSGSSGREKQGNSNMSTSGATIYGSAHMRDHRRVNGGPKTNEANNKNGNMGRIRDDPKECN